MTRAGFGTMLASAIAAATLAGCALGPDFARPEPPRADRYTPQPSHVEAAPPADDSAQHVVLGEQLSRDWWKLFQSDALDDVVQRALDGNRTLVAAASTLAQAQELAAAQAGTRTPQVGLSAGIGRQKYGAEFLGTLPKPPPFTYFAVGPTVSYALDYTGGVARSVEQQHALADYRRQQLDAAYLAVTGNAVMQALKMASLRAQIATVEAILDQDRENLKLVQVAFAAGSVSRLDIVTADSQLASDTTLLPPLRQELDLARHALAIVLGRPPAGVALPEFDLSQLALPRRLPVSLPSELAHRRPDILAAEAQLHAATAAVGIATANLYPHINLIASTGQQAVDFGRLFDRASNVWNFSGALLAPLFDGGTLRAEQRAAMDAMHASAANYEQTVLVAFGQVADSLQALDHDAEQLDAQAHAQNAAGENLDLTRKSYSEGNVGVLQVLDAERLYQQARLGYVRAQAQRYMDTVQLFLALGGSGPETDASNEDNTHPSARRYH
ncbi:MAG TPA: efflux transporter outer membrane subunit [Nitrospiria bacterium]|nr:efflux transporter outer membrane subunit [Nitrospiria bacterium]